ncbi:MAG: TerB family tellurite resistance protein [SAR324 cluster bacterium]|nr:TerB family tellurite resistance protein [SAR324 cluster bacterium]
MTPVPEKFAFTRACRKQFSFTSEEQFNHAVSILGLLASIVLSDHEIIAMEREILKRYLIKFFGISEEEAKELIDSLADGALHISIAEREHFQKYLKDNCSRKEKNAHLRLFFEFAAADRYITEQSSVLISRITRGIGLTLSEYELARLPYLHIITSQDSGVVNERSFKRIEYAYPAKLEYQAKKWKTISSTSAVNIKLNNISLSGFSCPTNSNLPEQSPLILILNHYFRLNAYVIRSSKKKKQWEISAEFDLDHSQFLHLKYLLDIENYTLEKCLNEEQLDRLSLIPLQILIVLQETSHSSQKITALILSRYLEETRGFSASLIHPLISRALEREEILEKIEKHSVEKDLQILSQGAALLEEIFPDTIAIFIKEEFCRWVVSNIAKRRVIWRHPTLDFEGKKVLEGIAQALDFDLSCWQYLY